jgi:3-hydroxymyristoyl/3-hydroxydecanoyl-(acyl carrier protein) dehydratase
MISPATIFQPFLDNLAQKDGKFFCQGDIKNDCLYTDGHFPNNPVLPAVALIDGSIEILKKITGKNSLEYRVKMAKFTNIIPPNSALEIYAYCADGKNWLVDWYLSKTLCASIEFVLP